MTDYDVFLSHSSEDKIWVQALAQQLRVAGLVPFLDSSSILAGDHSLDALAQAMASSRSCVVVIGHVLGQWQKAEIRVAIAKNIKNPNFRVIPIFMPGVEPGNAEISAFLDTYSRVHFSSGLDDDRAFKQLVAGIRGYSADEAATLETTTILLRDVRAIEDLPRVSTLADLHRLSRDRVRRLLKDKNNGDYSEFFQKYVASVYHRRDGTNRAFERFLHQEDKSCFVVTGNAGKGKTTLLCHLAENLDKQPGDFLPVLLSGSELSLGHNSLETAITEALVGETVGRLAHLAFAELASFLTRGGAHLVVFIDGLNELEGTQASRLFSAGLERMLRRIKTEQLSVYFCLSCRSELWFNFRNRIWAQDEIFRAAATRGPATGSASHQLGDFHEDEIDEVAARYFEWYAIEGELEGNARRSCCDPIMLRYLCAAYTHRETHDKSTPPDQIEVYRLGKIRSLRRKEAFDQFVQNRRQAMIRVVRRIYDIDEDEFVHATTTRYLITMAYAMYEKGQSYLNASEAITVAKELGHPDAQEAERGKIFFLRGEHSVFFRFIDEGIILSKVGADTFSFTFESYFEYSLGRYFGLERWPALAAEHGEKAVIKDFSKLVAEHRQLFESRQFSNLFGALHFAILVLEQNPIEGHENLFIQLIETMSHSSAEGFDWVQQACSTVREVEVAQKATWEKVQIRSPEERRLRHRFERLFGVLDHLTMKSEFLLIWDLEMTLLALAAVHLEITLERVRQWAISKGRYLQRIFAIQSLSRLCSGHPAPVAQLLLDLFKKKAYRRDFWLARGWIAAVRALAQLEGRVPENLRAELIRQVEKLAKSSPDPMIRAQALASLPILVSSEPTRLAAVEHLLEEESWPWARWNVAFELRYWDPDYGMEWPWRMLEAMAQSEDQHLRYVVESTLHEVRSQNPRRARELSTRLRGSRWRVGDDAAGARDERLGIVYSPAFLEPAYDNHVECRERVQAIISMLESVGDGHFTWVRPRSARSDELHMAHDEEIDQHRDLSAWPRYLDDVIQAGQNLKTQSDSSGLRTGPSELRYESYEAALLSVGAVLRAVDYVLDGPASFAMALNRPPGHLANNTICIFNNIAIAAHYAREMKNKERIFILDFDAHHGHHTYRVFRQDPDVVYCSIHIDTESAKLAGLPQHTGEGKGEGYSFSVNYPPAMEDDGYAYIVDAFLVPLIRQFKPQLILLSAGFDGHMDDPLTGGKLTEDAFIHLAQRLRDVSRKLDVKMAATFEGGYGFQGMSRSLVHMLRIFGDWPISEEDIGRSEIGKRPSEEQRQQTYAQVQAVVRELVDRMQARASRASAYAFDLSADCWRQILDGA